jgi:hypothetical protein
MNGRVIDKWKHHRRAIADVAGDDVSFSNPPVPFLCSPLDTEHAPLPRGHTEIGLHIRWFMSVLLLGIVITVNNIIREMKNLLTNPCFFLTVGPRTKKQSSPSTWLKRLTKRKELQCGHGNTPSRASQAR